MWLLNFRLSLRKLYRAIEIIWLVVSHLIHDWWVGTRMSKPFRRKARTALEVQSRTTEVRIRELIEDLGPTFVKFGQILADRPDLISEKLRNELKKLQTTARPIPDDEAVALIEEELGGPIDIFFESMDMTRIASASIGQVYRGTLKNGDPVVIKIQRPGIVSKIKIDLMLLKLVAVYLVKRYPEAASLNIVSVVDEFSSSLMKELNYHTEAGNILRFAELLKNDETFVAPKVYTSFTTSRLLVMEYIDGITPDETERLDKEGYDLHQIAVNGANILLKMILQHGVFHADPHGGNIFILPGNKICFIDYGMVAVLRPTHIQFLADFTMGFALGDSKKIANALIKLSGHRFFDFEEDLRFDVQETINRYSYLPFEKVNIAAVMMDCVTLIVKYKLQIPSSMYMLMKAIATIGKFGEKLSPEFEFAPILIPYAQQIILKEFSPQRFFHGLTDMIGDYIEMVRELPRDINEILYKAKQGKLVHEVSLKEDKKLRRTLRIVGMNMGLGLVTVILLICSTILSSRDQAPTVATLEFIGAFITGGWLLLRSMRRSMPG